MCADLHEQWQGCCVLLYHVAFQKHGQQAGVWAGVNGVDEDVRGLLLEFDRGTRRFFKEGQGIMNCPAS